MPAKPAPWYCPTVRAPFENEPNWGFSYRLVPGTYPAPLRFVFQFSAGGRLVEMHFSATLLRLFMFGAAYLALWVVLPRPLMEPGGVVFDPLVTWVVASIVGGSICYFFKIPALVGIIWIAAIWGNLPEKGYLTGGIHKQVRFIASRVGLTVIVSRAGFALNFEEVKKMWKNVAVMALVPLICEAVAHAMMAKALFNLPDYRFAFAQGFVTSGIAPSVLVPALLGLRDEGYGQGGPVTLMLSSVVFDIVASIWAVTFFADLIFQEKPIALAIALGPIQLIAGLIIGAVLGVLINRIGKSLLGEAAPVPKADGSIALEYTAVHTDSVRTKIFGLYSCVALALVFGGARSKFPGGGAIAVLGLSATLANLWTPPKAKPAPPPVPVVAEAPDVEGTPMLPPGSRRSTAQADVMSSSGRGRISASPHSNHDAIVNIEPNMEGSQYRDNSSNPWTREMQSSRTDAPNNNEPVPNGSFRSCVSHNRSDSLAASLTGSMFQVPADISIPGEAVVVAPPPPPPTDPDILREISLAEQSVFLNLKLWLLSDYAFLWDNFVMPALFSMSLSKIIFKDVFSSSFIGTALAVMFTGVGSRFVAALIVSGGNGFNKKEKLFLALGWCGKAAVQASLGGLVLELASEQSPQNPEYMRAGKVMNDMALLSAAICAPIAATAVAILGRAWLPNANAVKKDH